MVRRANEDRSNNQTHTRLRVSLASALALALGLLAPANAAVDPPFVEAILAPGESLQVLKTVDVPDIPPRVDIYFLADTTGSMAPVIAAVQAASGAVLGAIAGVIADVQFGAGQYRDFPNDAFAFSNDAPIGPVDGLGGNPDAADAIAAWSAGGGGDASEGQLFALDRIADPADPLGIGWRDGTIRILVWFGDAPGHDPVCSAISGLGADITEASATTKLVGPPTVTVVAISTLTGVVNGLDGDPTASAGDYVGICAVIDGAAGQATRIAMATGGIHLTNVPAQDIALAILTGIGAVTFDVTANAVDCEPLQITFDPPVRPGVSGPTTVQFLETIAVPPNVTPAQLPADGTVRCSVEFKAGETVIGTQEITIVADSCQATEAHKLAALQALAGPAPNPALAIAFLERALTIEEDLRSRIDTNLELNSSGFWLWRATLFERFAVKQLVWLQMFDDPRIQDLFLRSARQVIEVSLSNLRSGCGRL